MVRKVGFGDDDTESDSGQVRRGEPPKNSGAQRRAAAGTAEEPVPEVAAIGGPATPATTPVAGKPRWVAIFFLLIVLTTWLAMFGFVVASIFERRDDGVAASSMIWVALSIYGTIVLLRKLGHMYRGGSWLQTPADAVRKAGKDTA